jgi:TatD DNase family protein
MNPRLVDTHCHAHFAAFAGESDALIRRTVEVGVWMVLVGTNLETSTAAVRTAESFPTGVFAAIGLHPNHLHDPHHDPGEMVVAPNAETFDATAYDALTKSGKVVAVGETGLDYYRLPADGPFEAKLRQKNSFRSHIRFAREHDLPLIVHVRDAHDDVIDILRDEKDTNGTVTGVIHCFSGSADDAARYVALGFYASFSGTLTYPPRKSEGAENPLIAVARAVPADRLLVETDAPYLAPLPMRGKRNEPAFVEYTAAALAAARGVSVEEIALQTTQNALRLFNPVRSLF